MKKNKGAVLILIIVVLTISATFILYSYSNYLFSRQRDFLFSRYYERAIASALSCREAAMARLVQDFQYRNNELYLQEFKCKYSIKTNQNPTESNIYLEIFATGTTGVPKVVFFKPVTVSIISTVQISHIGPRIQKTIFQE